MKQTSPAPVDLSTKVRLRVPPERLWDFLADTDRMNRAVGLPSVSFTPLPDRSKKGHYHAEAKFLCMTMKYEEFPFDWVERRYYSVHRRFDAGPILEVTGGVRFVPVDDGTELEVFARIVPRNWLGWIAAKTALKKKATRDIVELAMA